MDVLAKTCIHLVCWLKCPIKNYQLNYMYVANEYAECYRSVNTFILISKEFLFKFYVLNPLNEIEVKYSCAVCAVWEHWSLFALPCCYLRVITKGARNLCATASDCESTQLGVGCTLIVFRWQPKNRSERSAQKTNALVCGLSINTSALVD